MKNLVVKAKVTLKIALDEPIKSGNRVMKAGEIPVEFMEHDLRKIIEKQLGTIKLAGFEIQHMEVN